MKKFLVFLITSLLFTNLATANTHVICYEKNGEGQLLFNDMPAEEPEYCDQDNTTLEIIRNFSNISDFKSGQQFKLDFLVNEFEVKIERLIFGNQDFNLSFDVKDFEEYTYQGLQGLPAKLVNKNSQEVELTCFDRH